MTTRKPSSTRTPTTAQKVVGKKTGETVVMVPATSSSSAYNYYANNSKARSAAVARFYGTSAPSRRKAAK